ncbi:MAG: TonB-dependent receptor [Lewinellaceae bacterium]|nr:TonB-dependent receptor [Lewinellaceae bacterium]
MKSAAFLILLFCFTGLTAQTAIIKGTVADAATNEPIPFANILVLDTETGATTDIDGHFEITGLTPGLYALRATYVGYQEAVFYELQATSAKPLVVDFRLEPAAEELAEIVVSAPPFKKTEESPVSLRTIGVTEIQRNPGANRDISKVVQSLPGVTSTASFRNDLIIRGGAPNENRFYLDEVETPNINHFATQGASGGPVGLINVNFIREVDFYSGAFPANRGNALSSVFNFQQRDGRDDRLGGNFTLGATDFGLMLEGPLSDKTTFLLSARRSYLQFLFKALGLPFLPTYNDFQAKVKYKIDKQNEISFIGLGAIDEFKLNLDADETEEQRFLLDQLPVAPQWSYTNGLVYKHYGQNGYWTFVLSRNMLNNEATKYLRNDDTDPGNLILQYRSQEIENKFRVERNVRFNSFKVIYGLNYERVKYNNRTFNRIFTGAGPQTVDYSAAFGMHKFGGFIQAGRKWLNERLTASVGFRIDGNSYSPRMSNPLDQFSPRASLSYALTDHFSLNFNTGIFYQLPPYTVLGYQENGELVNKENKIRYIRNAQLVFGVELNTAANSRFSLEGYYKAYNDYPFLLRDSVTLANLGGDFGVIGNEPAIPKSNGRTYGLEFLFQQRLFKGFYGIAAYTLGWSEFEDKNGIFVPSSWDARHIVSLTLGKKFGKNWEAGVNWRFQTGLPYTPFDEASSLVQSWDRNGRGLPDYDRINTLRTTAGNTVDIRVDKKWFFEKWSLNLYIDIENLTGNSVGRDQLILDRELDADGKPVGEPVIVNPDADLAAQRYRLKTINDAQGTVIPSIGLMLEF